MSDFKTTRLSEGFDEVTECVWEPNQVVRAHSHPFVARRLWDLRNVGMGK